MMKICILGLLVLGCVHGAPVKEDLKPHSCDDPHAVKAAHVALTKINMERNEGYIFSLHRLSNVHHSMHGENGVVYYLTIDVVETNCSVLSRKDWKHCEARPTSDQPVYGQCKAAIFINKVHRVDRLYKYDCVIKPVPSARVSALCPDCPTLISPDNEQVQKTLSLSLDKFNMESGLKNRFDKLKITRARAGMAMQMYYIVEYTIQETTCAHNTEATEKCPIMTCEFAHKGFCKADSESSEVSDADCPGSPAAKKVSPDSSSKFLLNAMAVEDYRKNHWPNLEKAIDRLLIQNPADHVSVSYAQIYGYIYKCVCQQHSELLYRDLTSKITAHLQQVSTQLQASPAENLIENFNAALTQFTASLQCIVPVFIYFNKFYIESKLNRDLKGDLMQLFAEHVAEKHLSALMRLLITAHSKPFQVQPSTMASVVKGLYSLQPEWAHLAPAVFSAFIPQIHPPAVESQLPDYAAHDQQLQLELSMNGFPRGDQSRKRTSEDS